MANLQTFTRQLATPHLISTILMSLLWVWNLSLKPVAETIYCFFTTLTDNSFSIILYLNLLAWQVNSVGTTTNVLQILRLLLNFSIEQLFSFIVLGNKDCDMSSFKFLFRLYVTLIMFPKRIYSIVTKGTTFVKMFF